jgi:hypothetical protein
MGSFQILFSIEQFFKQKSAGQTPGYIKHFLITTCKCEIRKSCQSVVHYFVITEEICEQAISRIFVSRLIEIFSLPLNLVLPRRSSMATYNSLHYVSLYPVFKCVFWLGLCSFSNWVQQASFLFHQSLQKILLRLKNRDSFCLTPNSFEGLKVTHWTPILNFAIPEFLPPECYENDFLCWKSSQNYILSCCNLKKTCDCFLLEPPESPTRELQMLCFKNSQRVFIKCFDSNGFY